MSKPDANTMRYSPGAMVLVGKIHLSGKLGSSVKDHPAKSIVPAPRLYSSIHASGSGSPLLPAASPMPVALAARNSLITTSESDAFGSTTYPHGVPVNGLGDGARSVMPWPP